jgi:RNA polymerase sigma-70 factor (ECF subfamily)
VDSQRTVESDAEGMAQVMEPQLPAPPRPLSFEAVYHAYFQQVVRWMRAMMIPPADIEDAAQEVFLVAQRKLSGFRGDNLAGWLYRIADLTARNYRRLAWFKHLFAHQPSDDVLDALTMGSTPAVTLEQKEDQQALAHMFSRMSAKRRETLLMFEVEGYSGAEIASLHGVPIKTVWTRLHHARKDLVAMVATARKQREREVGKP